MDKNEPEIKHRLSVFFVLRLENTFSSNIDLSFECGGRVLGTRSSQSMAGGTEWKNSEPKNISENNFTKINRRLEIFFASIYKLFSRTIQHEKLKQKFFAEKSRLFIPKSSSYCSSLSPRCLSLSFKRSP